MEEEISNVLGSIGLNKNEILIYLHLAKCGSLCPVFQISKMIGMHRSNVYDSLRSLANKGFVIESIVNGAKSFKAVDPNKLKDYIKQKEIEIDSIIPKIKVFSKTPVIDEEISIAKGCFIAREALLDLLKLNSTILVFGASKEALDALGEGFLDEFHKQRIKSKITMKHIYNKDVMDRVKYLNRLKYTEAKHLPEKFDSLASTLICNNKVLFFIFSRPSPTSVITITNKEISDSYKGYFDILWKASRI